MAHVHRDLEEPIIKVNGIFEIILDDNQIRRVFNLSIPYMGFYTLAGLWRGMDNIFCQDLFLVKALHQYYELDYIREYQIIKNFKEKQ